MESTPHLAHGFSLSVPIALTALSLPAAAQTTLYEYAGDPPSGPTGSGAQMGRAVSGAGEVDGDGFGEFAIASPNHDGAQANHGRVELFSGISGLRLQVWDAPAGSTLLGAALDLAGDADGDGADDLVAGAPQEDTAAFQAGAAHLLRGTGGVLWSVHGASMDTLGNAVAGGADLQGDGYADVIVSNWGHDAPGLANAGRVTVHSGPDGGVLIEYVGTAAQLLTAFEVDFTADVDLDGFPDLVVGLPYDSSGGANAGALACYSGAGSGLLFEAPGSAPGLLLGTAVAALGDFDSDGYPEMAASSPWASTGGAFSGVVNVYSGSGALLFSASGAAHDYLGWSLDGGADIDGDGAPEILAGAPQREDHDPVIAGPGYALVVSATGVLASLAGESFAEGFGISVGAVLDLDADTTGEIVVGVREGPPGASGAARVLSLFDLPLSSDGHVLSLAAGGTRALSLDAGPAHAGDLHLLAGSLTGIAPPTPVGSLALPLVADTYTVWSLQLANQPPFGNSFGVLDAAGAATTTFSIPAGSPPQFAGLTLHHAWLAFSALGVPELASNPVPLSLLP